MEEITGDLLSGARAAERQLHRNEIRRLKESLPEGHPLLQELDAEEARMDGDLGGLPTNHPLILAMKAAAERWDQEHGPGTGGDEDEEGLEDGLEAENPVEVRKAKKLDARTARREEIAKDEEQTQARREAAKEINDQIAIAMGAMKELYRVVSEREESLISNPLARTKTERLKRLLYAVERGLSDSRIMRV